jgi:allophanate hydrolase
LRDDVDRAGFEYAASRKTLVIAVPRKSDREFFGNEAGRALFEEALEGLERIGVELQPIDFGPFVECGQLLFEGPWIAERSAAFGVFAEQHQDDVLPVIHRLLSRARTWSAADAFEAFYRRRNIAASVRTLLQHIDAIAVPTVAPLYTIEEVLADPIVRNDHHGRYSYFANLLDLAAVSVPSGHYANGMPFGITFLGPAFSDGRIARIAGTFHASRNLPLGVPRAPVERHRERPRPNLHPETQS